VAEGTELSRPPSPPRPRAGGRAIRRDGL